MMTHCSTQELLKRGETRKILFLMYTLACVCASIDQVIALEDVFKKYVIYNYLLLFLVF